MENDVSLDNQEIALSEDGDRFFTARLREVIGEEKPSSFAKRAGIKDGTFRSYLQGTMPSLDKAIQISRAGNVSLEWLATGYGSKIPKGIPTLRDRDQERLADGTFFKKSDAELKAIDEHTLDLDFTALPVIDIPASAGAGYAITKEDRDKWILFERLWLYNNLNMNVDTLFCMHCVGESMEPTLHSGELLIASKSDVHLKIGDGIYIIRLEGHVFVKRLQLMPGNRLMISSDNPLYKPYEISLDEGTDFKPLGKVVMVTGSRRV